MIWCVQNNAAIMYLKCTSCFWTSNCLGGGISKITFCTTFTASNPVKGFGFWWKPFQHFQSFCFRNLTKIYKCTQSPDSERHALFLKLLLRYNQMSYYLLLFYFITTYESYKQIITCKYPLIWDEKSF